MYGQEAECHFTVKGKVLDIVTEEPLPFATISILESGQGVAADEHGDFLIENICYEEFHIEVQFLGYKTIEHHHDLFGT